MQESAVQEAAKLLVAARRNRTPLQELPAELQPSSFAEAVEIQQAVLALLGEASSAYKVVGVTPEASTWAPIVSSVFQPSPARFAAASVPLLGVEAEIAYRLEDDLTEADRSMTMEDFDRRVVVVPTLEVVATRFVSYQQAPFLQRAADFMSNGGLVHGEVWKDAGEQDLSKLAIRLYEDDALIADVVGGHAAVDPRLPALAFIQAPGRPDRLPRGTLITTGSYTGLLFAKPGSTVRARFSGYGDLLVSFPTED